MIKTIKTLKQASILVGGGLTKTSKMPTLSYSIPAKECKQGQKLRKISGSVCATCYAQKGNYVRYKAIEEAQYKRLYAIKQPFWVSAMVYLIENSKATKESGLFRWHDAGDLQNTEHLRKIMQVVYATPNIKHWLPTKEKRIVEDISNGKMPPNLIIRLSGSLVDGQPPKTIFNTSTVTSDKSLATCKSFETQGKCGDCRKCWDSTLKNIVYLKH
jgi:hypothetical protein